MFRGGRTQQAFASYGRQKVNLDTSGAPSIGFAGLAAVRRRDCLLLLGRWALSQSSNSRVLGRQVFDEDLANVRSSFNSCSAHRVRQSLASCNPVFIGLVFNIIVYFYWPCILLVAAIVGSSGESAMIAVPIYGMALGMILYSIILATILGYVRKKRA